MLVNSNETTDTQSQTVLVASYLYLYIKYKFKPFSLNDLTKLIVNSAGHNWILWKYLHFKWMKMAAMRIKNGYKRFICAHQNHQLSLVKPFQINFLIRHFWSVLLNKKANICYVNTFSYHLNCDHLTMTHTHKKKTRFTGSSK